ncbi:MAG: beta-N-acetylhexosaminidase [Alphaproteobacteria bacterium]|nr:beta-N-acetylhexosaminidase [Alphaproteobacteria bacterium]
MTIHAVALGVRQTKVDADLRAFLRDAEPWSLILFREACASRAQVKALCADLREAAGHDAIVYIDQEGGRVARMRPPEWPAWPAPKAYGDVYARDAHAGAEAAKLGHRLIAHELKALGVNGDFAPVCDTPVDGADPIIGDRAFSSDPEAISVLGRAALDGLRAGGVVGCVKHMPGHGRAEADSHLALPRIGVGHNQLGADFAPFRALSDAEVAMTAHIVFEALDPDNPATHSRIVIENLIRQTFGFRGLLVSDDLDMKALSGTLRARAEKAFAAGCDVVLQCSGKIADMAQVLQGAPALAGEAVQRAHAAEAVARAAPAAFDAAAAWWRLRTLIGPSIRAPA